MDGARWERICALAGTALAPVVLSAAALLPQPFPDHDDDVAAYFERERARLVVVAAAAALATVLFVAFLSGLRSVLRRAEGETGALSAATVIADSAAAALGLCALAAWLALLSVEGPASAVTLLALLDGLLIALSVPIAAMLAAAATAIASVAVLPRRIAYLAGAASLLQLFAWAGVTSGDPRPAALALVVALAWCVAACVAMLTSERAR